MITLRLRGKTGHSRILIGESMRNIVRYSGTGRPAVVVTDENVHRFYAKAIPPWPVVTVPPGERSKTLTTVFRIYREFLRLRVDREWLVAGVGGGVVCDLAGFAASTYLRGLEFGFAATTLLAQVDAALGGKNGVNLSGYKNQIGTFRQPGFVICDFEALKTLPEKEIRCGMAEIIKAAAIADQALFEFLEEKIGACLSLEPRALGHAVERSCRVKIAVVGRDEREAGERRKLNFGHTVGHALEKNRRLSHGEAVAAGMAAAARLSVRKGLLSPEEESRLTGLLKQSGLPTSVRISGAALRQALCHDKKRKGRLIRFVLLNRLGTAVVRDIEPEEIIEAVHDLR